MSLQDITKKLDVYNQDFKNKYTMQQLSLLYENVHFIKKNEIRKKNGVINFYNF